MSKTQRALAMGSLVLAGESIYLLPYALRRDYENALLGAMDVTATELGWLSSVFGVFALLCYVPGGWLADRWPARRLLTLSLVSTGMGGLYLTSFPGFAQLLAVHAFWGVTSILTFWGALIKATRAWGGAREQGRAFGLLEGGRGWIAFALAAAGGVIFAAVPSRAEGLRTVILFHSGCALAAGALTWLFIPATMGGRAAPADPGDRQPWRSVLSSPAVWLQAVILLAAYMGYWGTFALSKLAVDGYGASDAVGSAVSISAVGWRGVVAVGAGFVADRVGASRTVLWAFAALGLACLVFTVGPMGSDQRWLLWANAAALGAATYALRGVYFALLEEGRVSMSTTGRVVGLLSVIGYAPDVFVPPLRGTLLDQLPGTTGHRVFFAVLAAAAVVGWLATLAWRRLLRRPGPAGTHTGTA